MTRRWHAPQIDANRDIKIAGHGRDPKDSGTVRLRLRTTRPGVRQGQRSATHPLPGVQGWRVLEPGQRPTGRTHLSDHLPVG